MRTTPNALFVALFLLVGFSLTAQQPTKTKTKTPTSKTKSKNAAANRGADTSTMGADTTRMGTSGRDSTMQGSTSQGNMNTSNPTNMEGGGGGGAAGAYPYTATYSSQFTVGNPEHSRMVLSLWKDYDNNTLDRSMAMFADTVAFETPDGQIIRGRDSVMMTIKKWRSQYASAKSTVEAFVPMHSTDRNEDFVLVWGREDDTGATGNTSTMLHEVWGINRDNKVFYIRQYTAKPPVR